jgi:hypothetical protein
MEKMRNAYTILEGKYERRKPFGRPRSEGNNIKIVLQRSIV